MRRRLRRATPEAGSRCRAKRRGLQGGYLISQAVFARDLLQESSNGSINALFVRAVSLLGRARRSQGLGVVRAMRKEVKRAIISLGSAFGIKPVGRKWIEAFAALNGSFERTAWELSFLVASAAIFANAAAANSYGASLDRVCLSKQ
jgi:hypothetical protein